AKGYSIEIQLLNRQLQEIYSELIRIEKQLYDEGGTISIEEIYARYRNKSTEHTLFEIYKERLRKMEALVGKEYTPATLKKFKEVYAHVQEYVAERFGVKDIPLKQLGYAFIKQYEEFLLERGLKPITINKIIQRLRQMITYALRCNYIQRDPFVDYKPLKERKQLVFLTQEELDKLEGYHFSQERLEQVKNIYLFSVYTGLAYNEAVNLRHDHISRGFDGSNWITLIRQKTDREFSVPLLPQAEKLIGILAKSRANDGYVLPRISNQKINSYLKEIAEIVGIHKKLTHHTARKTFASTVLLYHDVPIEVVSMLLGHSDIAVTQKSYAQVVNRNISNHMNLLEKRLQGKN
ncbi:MAG: site-specific integrase, partial [Lachnospiraceae bacterium]|nr:site-specific integrase [Lachnospiraceae bacterium]